MALFVTQTISINTPSIVNSAGVVLPANDERKFFSIQNVGVNPIFILITQPGSTALASTSVFHAVIKGGTGASDGLGGSYSSGIVCPTGIISIAGTTPLCVVTEM